MIEAAPSLDSSHGVVNRSIVNPFKQINPTNVSRSVAKMQREGLQLNRKPELAAALRQSSQTKNSHTFDGPSVAESS